MLGKIFKGPVFIVGMPRSGTKLLRGLLNQHSRIGIPVSETEFLPWLVRNHSRFGDLSDREIFGKFYREMLKIHYFQRMEEEGGCISEDVWYRSCTEYTAAELFETLVRHDAGISANSNGIWGDKSPSYIGRIQLLKELYPDARIVHIIRDVRDYCLSMRNAWGKSMLRAAQRWVDSVSQAEDARHRFPDDVLCLRYEDLLENTESELNRLCIFLGVEYEPAMSVLETSVENLGSAKGVSEVKRDNKKKYLTRMNSHVRMQIESISWLVLDKVGYPYDYKGPVRRLNGVVIKGLQVYDSLNLFRFHIAEQGWIRGVLLVLRLYSTSGNRNV